MSGMLLYLFKHGRRAYLSEWLSSLEFEAEVNTDKIYTWYDAFDPAKKLMKKINLDFVYPWKYEEDTWLKFKYESQKNNLLQITTPLLIPTKEADFVLLIRMVGILIMTQQLFQTAPLSLI